MAVDTPARIAILGAGPIGLETALYARYLGYDVDVYEQERVAANVLGWGHVRMFSPFRMNRSPLGLAALRAQDESYERPEDEALLTGAEWAERYLLPLAQTDLLSDHIQEGSTVVAIGRTNLLKNDLIGDSDREDDDFRILVRTAAGDERTASADVVIDTTGVYGQPNWLGAGGIPAVGEIALRHRLDYHLPDVLGTQRARFARQHTLLVGSGFSAATTLLALAELVRQEPGTRVTWVTRQPLEPGERPIREIPEDSLPERRRITDEANQLASTAGGPITHHSGTRVEAIRWDAEENRFQVQLAGGQDGWHAFDAVVAHVGYRPNLRLFDELQVQLCYATEGPLPLAASLLKHAGADCLQIPAGGADMLMHPEPHFYVLGAKSYGRNSQFLFANGLQQIRQLFTVIGDRETLDLYGSAERLIGE